MDASAFENLDLACAKTGQAIAEKPSKELEKLVTTALAVLEEQGVYALFLFLKTRGGKAAPTIEQKKRRGGPLCFLTRAIAMAMAMAMSSSRSSR